mgnify:CR=1 FL=1
MTDPRLTLEERIEAELKSYDGTMGLYMDDLKGNVITRLRRPVPSRSTFWRRCLTPSSRERQASRIC